MNRQTLGVFVIVLLAAALRCCGAEPVHAKQPPRVLRRIKAA